MDRETAKRGDILRGVDDEFVSVTRSDKGEKDEKRIHNTLHYVISEMDRREAEIIPSFLLTSISTPKPPSANASMTSTPAMGAIPKTPLRYKNTGVVSESRETYEGPREGTMWRPMHRNVHTDTVTQNILDTGTSNRSTKMVDSTIQANLPVSTPQTVLGIGIPNRSHEMVDSILQANLPVSTPTYTTPSCSVVTSVPTLTTSVSHSTVIPKPIMLPDPYDGRGNLDDYLSHFNLCKQINGWDDTVAAQFLASKLRGSALQMYTDLSPNEKNNLAPLIKSLKSRFDPNNDAEVYRTELRIRKQKPNESFSDLAGAIRRLVNRAYPRTSLDEKDEFAKEAFINALSHPSIRVQVRRGHPKSLEDAKRIAIEEETLLRFENRDNIATVKEDKYIKLERRLEAMSQQLEKFMYDKRDQNNPNQPRRPSSWSNNRPNNSQNGPRSGANSENRNTSQNKVESEQHTGSNNQQGFR